TKRKPWMIIMSWNTQMRMNMQWLQKRQVEEIQLQPLREEHHETLIGEMMGGASVPIELKTYVQNQTNGNPLFIRLCIQAAIDKGYLWLSEEGEWHFEWQSNNLLYAPAPQSVSDILASTVEQFGAEELQLCQLLAIFGQATPVSELAIVMNESEVLIQTWAAPLIRSAILIDAKQDDPYLNFSHWGIQHLLLDTLGSEEKKRIHRRIASLLEERPIQDYAQMARHHHFGGNPEKAHQLYHQAADKARDNYELVQAELLFEKAIRLCRDSSALHGIQIKYADVLLKRGLVEKAKVNLKDVIQNTSDEGCKAKARYRLSEVLMKNQDFVEAEKHLRAASQYFNREGIREGILDVLSLTSIIALEQNDYAIGIETLQQLREQAEQWHLPSHAFGASHNLMAAYFEIGKYAEALKESEVLLARSRSDNRQSSRIRVLNTKSLIHMYQGDLQEALIHCKQALRLAKKFGLRTLEITVLGNLGLIYMQQEQYEDSIDLSMQVARLSSDLGLGTPSLVAEINILLCRVELAHFEQALSIIQKLDSNIERLGTYLLGYLYFAKARFYRYQNQGLAARDCILKGLALFQQKKIPQPYHVLLCEHGHIELVLEHSIEEVEKKWSASREYLDKAQLAHNSELGLAVARLGRAISWRKQGKRLTMGSVLADLPQKLQ
ncbi:MAG: tetratricopeptide repeat protein, partial [Myxococcota bacterium]|nr:tetratricopeptide repeat protein [Myxococcota bacterium]